MRIPEGRAISSSTTVTADGQRLANWRGTAGTGTGTGNGVGPI
jgi:hypothetical protein